MNQNPLGKTTEYRPHYDPSLLFVLPRADGRLQSGIGPSAATGYDRWNCFELGWLGPFGKPEVRTIQIVYPADSTNIVESKSLKLYLGSFTMSRFESEDIVVQTVKRDLSAILGAKWVEVALGHGRIVPDFALIDPAKLIDGLPVACDAYHPDPALLASQPAPDGEIATTLLSHLLKTNCPVTGQPDWATVVVSYAGERELSHEGLLRYIVSYREHGGYHELCCEQIFGDLMACLKPSELVVKCYFTRRGGIDITPCRFFGRPVDHDWGLRYWRQ